MRLPLAGRLAFVIVMTAPHTLSFTFHYPALLFITRLLFYRVTTAAQLAPINQKRRLPFFEQLRLRGIGQHYLI
jgi:hypothetical protein